MLLDRNGAQLAIVNRDSLLAETRWHSHADSIGTWPVDDNQRSALPTLTDCARAAEIGSAFRELRPIGHAETDVRFHRHGWLAVVEMFVPVAVVRQADFQQALAEGVRRCGDRGHLMTTPILDRWHASTLDSRPAYWRACQTNGAWHAILYSSQVSERDSRELAALISLMRARIGSACAA